MATPRFNQSGANGLAELYFVNGGMTAKLSATGNTVEVHVDAPQMKESEFAGPGGNWVGKRTHGLGPRLVTWVCVLKCAKDADLNQVEAWIERYIGDGGAYVLDDGKSRTSSYARMLGAPQTRRVGRRQTGPSGIVFQRWEIAFEVIRPQVGANNKL